MFKKLSKNQGSLWLVYQYPKVPSVRQDRSALVNSLLVAMVYNFRIDTNRALMLYAYVKKVQI